LPDGSSLQTVYAVDGGRNLHELTLSYLEGYCRSTPVRVGNDAYKQLQLDIYGALTDAVYLYNKYAEPITSVLWKDVRRLVNWVADNWQKPDRGIWELRGDARQLVHSKMMCWVALDRGLRLAETRCPRTMTNGCELAIRFTWKCSKRAGTRKKRRSSRVMGATPWMSRC
jgi:GH15 family glucan-1,4-alpha-glucosidase